MNCDILKSKLILCEWNAFYFIEIAFIGFTLDEIKQCIVFLGHPVEQFAIKVLDNVVNVALIMVFYIW